MVDSGGWWVGGGWRVGRREDAGLAGNRWEWVGRHGCEARGECWGGWQVGVVGIGRVRGIELGGQGREDRGLDEAGLLALEREGERWRKARARVKE